MDELTAQNAATAAVEGAEPAEQGNTPPAAKIAHTAQESREDGSADRDTAQG